MTAAAQGTDIPKDYVWQAGIAVAKKIYQYTKTHAPAVGMISGGARGLRHFTEMVGADVVFMRAFRGDFDAVVTMYHDQGQIALKAVGFDQGVTISGGQPYPITTAAHGTAFGRAGQGRASTTAFENALNVLCRMAQSRK